MTRVRIKHQVVVFDSADLAAESTFWAGVLGGTVDPEDDRPATRSACAG